MPCQELSECPSYMSARVLMNSLKEFGKSDKMRGLQRILSHFRNEFAKFNTTYGIKITLKHTE